MFYIAFESKILEVKFTCISAIKEYSSSFVWLKIAMCSLKYLDKGLLSVLNFKWAVFSSTFSKRSWIDFQKLTCPSEKQFLGFLSSDLLIRKQFKKKFQSDFNEIF